MGHAVGLKHFPEFFSSQLGSRFSSGRLSGSLSLGTRVGRGLSVGSGSLGRALNLSLSGLGLGLNGISLDLLGEVQLATVQVGAVVHKFIIMNDGVIEATSK